MKTDTYNVNNNPPGSPHEGRRAPHAQPTSALRAHTPCWLAMAWSFLELLLHLLHHLHQSCVEAVLLGRLLVGVDELALLLGESKWKASTPAPAQREKKIIRWSGGSFQAEEGGEERVWECANGPVDHTCNASLLAGRPRFFSAGSQPSVRQQPRLRHPPIWHGLAGPEHAALLVTIVRAALLPVHHYLPRAAARLLSVCVKAVRFPAGA